jgi:NADPH-dependent curcumin reductase CurA
MRKTSPLTTCPIGKPGQVYHPVAVKEVPVPSPKEGEVLVKIDYAAFNHRCARWPGTVAEEESR